MSLILPTYCSVNTHPGYDATLNFGGVHLYTSRSRCDNSANLAFIGEVDSQVKYPPTLLRMKRPGPFAFTSLFYRS